MRVAEAAGDHGRVRRLLYGGDGRSPAEIEAAAAEEVASRSAWATVLSEIRDERLATVDAAMERRIEDMEESALEQYAWDARPSHPSDDYDNYDFGFFL